MGTNFYLHTDFCQCCGKPKKKIHLGKRSGGLRFLFHKTDTIKDFQSFCDTIIQGVIYDEYDNLISTVEMLDIIQDSQNDEHHQFVEIIDGYDFLACDFC